MNNLRISILSLTIILFSLGALMLPVNTTLAHHCKGAHRANPECDVGKDDGVVTYSATFSGALPGSSNGDTYTTSGKGLGSASNHDDLLTTIDLTFFADLFGTAGDNCFGGGVGFDTVPNDLQKGHTFNPGAVGFRQGRRGRAEATVIFKAKTDNGDTPAIYSLHTVGDFLSDPSGWPPSEVSTADIVVDGIVVGNKDAILRMTSWEMLLNNHNPSDLMGACLSEGLFSLPGTMGANDWQITVSLD